MNDVSNESYYRRFDEVLPGYSFELLGAAKTDNSENRLMANMEKPFSSKQYLLMWVVHSIFLYGCEVWLENVKTNFLQNAEDCSVKRRFERSICLQNSVWTGGIGDCRHHSDSSWGENYVEGWRKEKVEDRKTKLRHWQKRYDKNTRGRSSWTSCLIRNLEKWFNPPTAYYSLAIFHL